MASSSKIYMDLSSISIDNPLRVILFHIKNNLNKIVDASYCAMGIKELEVGRAPLIRNAARVRDFHYSPQDNSDTYVAILSYFVHEEMVGGSPQNTFKFTKDKEAPSHQHRSIRLNYGYTDNGLDKYGIAKENDNILVVSMGDDFVGQSIMQELSALIKADFPNLRILLEESSLKENDLKEVMADS